MYQLSIVEMKALIGGGDTQSNGGETGHGTKGGDGGETGHGNRSTCIAIVQYRHSNSPVFTSVPNCNNATKDGSMIVSCNC